MHIVIIIRLLLFFNQSAEALNMVKHDLSEFVSTIQHDTSAVVADTATAVKESLKVMYMYTNYESIEPFIPQNHPKTMNQGISGI